MFGRSDVSFLNYLLALHLLPEQANEICFKTWKKVFTKSLKQLNFQIKGLNFYSLVCSMTQVPESVGRIYVTMPTFKVIPFK
jgi:hypothetical protein